jgi:hypothetical protein
VLTTTHHNGYEGIEEERGVRGERFCPLRNGIAGRTDCEYKPAVRYFTAWKEEGGHSLTHLLCKRDRERGKDRERERKRERETVLSLPFRSHVKVGS